MEATVVGKRDWPGIKLAVATKEAAGWVGRGPVPDGSRAYLADYRPRCVNMRGVDICRVQHGFGQWKQIPPPVRPAEMGPEEMFGTTSAGASRAATVKAGGSVGDGGRAGTAKQVRTATAKAVGWLTIIAREAGLTGGDGTRGGTRGGANTFGAAGGGRVGTGAGAGPSGGDSVASGESGSTWPAMSWDESTRASMADDVGGSGGGGRPETGQNREQLVVPFLGPEFAFYHGQWCEGKKHGMGVELTPGGAFYGAFDAGQRRGGGEMHYANGDHTKATFSTKLRFPQAGDLSDNPYAAGVPDGPVEIVFGDGGVYTGQMTAGRITGKGSFRSALGCCASGDFKDGRLHGDGKDIDARGRVRAGDWQDGQLHGHASCSGAAEKRYRRGTSSSFAGAGGGGGGGDGGQIQGIGIGDGEEDGGERYEGDWAAGQRHGFGRQQLPGGKVYEGFMGHDERWGLGAMWHGCVKTVVDANTGRAVLRSNRVYEGEWRGGEPRPEAMVTLTAKATAHCVGACRSGRFARAIGRATRREEAAATKARERNAIHEKYEALLRRNVEKRKQNITRRQIKGCCA
ncbi:unnamed protein product [Phaeothamnion confervicola]